VKRNEKINEMKRKDKKEREKKDNLKLRKRGARNGWDETMSGGTNE